MQNHPLETVVLNSGAVSLHKNASSVWRHRWLSQLGGVPATKDGSTKHTTLGRTAPLPPPENYLAPEVPIAKASDTLGKPCPGGKSHQRLMELGIQLFHSEPPLPVLESQGFLAAVEERDPRGLRPVHSPSSTASQGITGLGCGWNSSSSAPAVRPQRNRIIGSVVHSTPLCPNLLSFGFQNPDCIATHLERGKGEKSFLGCSGCVSSARL